MEKFRDEDQVTKLWDQFAINKLHILVKCLFEFTRFVKMTIVEVISNIKIKKHFLYSYLNEIQTLKNKLTRTFE
jgi:hypothetical protein